MLLTTITDATLPHATPPLPVSAFEDWRDAGAEEIGDLKLEEAGEAIEVADVHATVAGQDLRQPRTFVVTMLGNGFSGEGAGGEQRTNILREKVMRFECHAGVGQSTTERRQTGVLNWPVVRTGVVCGNNSLTCTWHSANLGCSQRYS